MDKRDEFKFTDGKLSQTYREAGSIKSERTNMTSTSSTEFSNRYKGQTEFTSKVFHTPSFTHVPTEALIHDSSRASEEPFRYKLKSQNRDQNLVCISIYL